MPDPIGNLIYPGPNNPASGPTGRSATDSSQNAELVFLDNQLLGTVNVKAFGATGNGVTDDTAAIQSAITAAQVQGAGTNVGATVFFPAGTYLISSPLTIPDAGITLRGISNWNWGANGSTISLGSTFSGSAGIIIAASNVAIEAISFATVTATNAIPILSINPGGSSRTSYYTIKDVVAFNSGGILVDNCEYVRMENVVLQAWSGSAGFSFTNSQIIVMFNCNSAAATTGTSSSCIYDYYFSGCESLVMNNCEANNVPYVCVSLQNTNDCSFTDLETNGSVTYQIQIQGCTDLFFNRLYTAYCEGTVVQVQNSDIIGFNAGWIASGTTGSFVIDGSNLVLISDLHIAPANNQTGTTNTGTAISFINNTYAVLIENNTFAPGSTSSFIDDTSTDVGRHILVQGNVVAGGSVSSIVKAGAATTNFIARNNIGIPPIDNTGQFNVKDYGALGNGSTDDTAAIAAAITAAEVSGGVVYFPPGIYNISSPLTISTSGVILRGAAEWDWGNGGSTINLDASWSGAAGVLINIGNATIENLSFSTVSATTSVPIISANSAGSTVYDSFTVRNVVAVNSGGIKFNKCTDVLLENVDLQAWSGTAGYSFTTCQLVYLENCNASPASTGTTSSCEYNYYFSATQTVDCYSSESNGTPYISLYLSDTNDCTFVDFECSGSVNDGIVVTGCTDVMFDRLYTGYVQGTCMWIQNCSIVSLLNGWLASGNSGSLLIDGSTIVNVSGVHIAPDNNVTGTTNAGTAISIVNAAHSILISENIFAPGNTSSFLTDASTVAGRHILVDSNIVTGSSLSSVVESSTTAGIIEVRNNIGINPIGLVTVTVPASGTAVASAIYDRTFYITAGASIVACAVTDAAGTSQTIATIPSSGFGAIMVPAGSTFTPTYTAAPTWTVQGN